MTTQEEWNEYVPLGGAIYNEAGWLGEAAQSLYIHKDAGMGVRCGFYLGPWVSVRAALTWDSVTCPDCRKLKQNWEPETQTIDTRGD